MSMEVRRFGGPRREMVGMLQRPDLPAEDGAALLLCKPFGQEAVRTNQMFQALANRLCREGCTVLRFDYHGSGDSPGEGADQTLEQWTGDTLLAWRELESCAAGAPVHLFGIGLGATLAARAALRATRPPGQVLLWEPVLEGRAYLSALLEAHRREVAREMQAPWERLRREGRVQEPTLPGSVIGFEMGAAMVREIESLDVQPMQALLSRGLPLRCGVQPAQARALRAADLPEPLLRPIEESIDWMSGDARGTAIVPREIQAFLLDGLPQRA